ncbi:aminoglycoside phosphotransferase family protein [Roseovarius atlanticus]|uniref:aminoglycoside phosphotransferase family protein n=1 Tax=Roseovarius atlanticus TaxID=1641875 RepID=UPI001C984651|nr:phosphotransferase [Roseovarius atlanticus]MBY5987194.1 phosphotransferase [Roseovarius atlanticus]MBY6125834.1 phosphotransferase [Roseovarius atlanticus]MBY6149705.1 phosphotransferase [Roseovarius atlanticus]
MTDRNAQIEAFVENAGWGDAVVSHLAGDASNRRYLRLIRPSNAQRAVLMDAPPEKGEDVRPFVKIASYLTSVGLSAPRILHRDDDAGFLLLEDLGDALFASIVPRNPDLEDRLYSTAIDVLVHLHAQPAPDGLAPYDPATATSLSALVFDWYVPGATDTTDSAERPGFEACLQDLLAEHAADCDVLIQRDYHAQNLLWLPDRKGVARVGLLDFQDAMLGHRAYDLVSLLQDARRDVPPALEARMRDRYALQTARDPQAFATAYAVLGAQRNLRILGVFARLCIRDGKAHYVDLIPRVWGLLQRDLALPALAPLKALLDRALPPPDAALLEKLKSKCATPQMQ